MRRSFRFRLPWRAPPPVCPPPRVVRGQCRGAGVLCPFEVCQRLQPVAPAGGSERSTGRVTARTGPHFWQNRTREPSSSSTSSAFMCSTHSLGRCSAKARGQGTKSTRSCRAIFARERRRCAWRKCAISARYVSPRQQRATGVPEKQKPTCSTCGVALEPRALRLARTDCAYCRSASCPEAVRRRAPGSAAAPAARCGARQQPALGSARRLPTTPARRLRRSPAPPPAKVVPRARA